MKEKLIDGWGRKIDYLRLSVTDRCNLRCIYCMPGGGITLLEKKQLLTFEEIIRLVKIFVELGIKKIKITGGEPLLRENILDLIKKISRLEGVEDISLTTNGTLLDKYLNELYKIGIRRINVSLDSLNPEKFKIITRGGNLDQVLSGIFEAVKVGFDPVKINTVLTGLLDEKDILGFVKLTMENPVSVRFIEMMPVADFGSIECGRIGVCKGKENSNITTDAILSIMGRLGTFYKIKGPSGYGPAVYYKLEGSKGSIGLIIDDKKYCRYCNRIRLTPKGTIRLCLFSQNEFDIKSELRGGSSDEDMKRKLLDFVKTKPKDREDSCRYDNRSNLRISSYMNQIGG